MSCFEGRSEGRVGSYAFKASSLLLAFPKMNTHINMHCMYGKNANVF